MQRLREIYLKREASIKNSVYSWEQADVQFQKFQYRRAVTKALLSRGWRNLSGLKILDLGCGSGAWLASLLDWGAEARNLHGLDALDFRIQKAKASYPHLQFIQADAAQTNFPSNKFDLITVNTVFSSVLSAEKRQDIAAESLRILKPGGMILIYDFAFRNPSNPNVVSIGKSEIKKIYGEHDLKVESLNLFPPLARLVSSYSLPLAAFLEWTCPFLRTHRLYRLKIAKKV